MAIGAILLSALILLMVGTLPTWPYNSKWGYYPSGGFGIVRIFVVLLQLSGRL
jgi:hypothetical protein